MTNKERSKAIREEIKKLGYNTKQVSVRSRYCGYSDATDITVKDLNCDIKAIEKACTKFESIDYDQYSGEILSGGNTYISVKWDYEALKKVEEEKMQEAENLIAEAENGKVIFENTEKKLVLCKSGEQYDIAEFLTGYYCGTIKVTPCTKERMKHTLAYYLATKFQEVA